MSNYTKSTNFATKDNLSPGNPLKIVKGTEIDTEFNNIQTAVATKTDNASAAITGGSITGITDLAVADGGTGASTATAALNNLLPTQTGNANKYLQTDGTNATWDAVSLSTSDITGTLPVANGGTGVTSSTGTGSVVLSNSPTLVTPALGTPASGTATNLTGLPISTGVSGLGTGVATFLGTPSSANLASAVTDETGSGALVFANSPTLVTPALGTPSALVGTNITGTASGLTAGNVTTNANLTGAVTSVGNASSLGSFTSAQLLGALTDETGTGSAVFATSPTLVTPILGTPTSATLTNATGLPLTTGVTGQLPVANGGTGTATPSIVAGTGVTVSGSWPNQTIAASGGTGTVTSVDVSGGTTGLTTSGGPVTSSGTVTLAGTLAVANGGSGQTSYTNGQLLIGNTTGNTLTKTTLTAGTGVTITNGTGSITIAASGGSGDVVGPASSTDNAITRFDSTTGKLVQNSLVTVADDGAITAPQVGSVIPFYYANQAAFPSASTYHGAVAHSHSDGAMYFAHGNAWNRLLDDVTDVTVAQGGTGLSTLTANNVIIGNGTSTPLFVAPSSSGNVLTSNGTTWTSSAPAAGGITYTTVKTANYTAVNNDGVQTNTTAGAFTVTLPATPSNGNQVIVVDSFNIWGTNNLTIGRNGSTIEGLAQDLVCDITGVSVQCVYNGTTWDIFAQIGGAGGSVVSGPASSTDNAIARFDLTTGKIIQNSVVTIADTTGNVAGVGTLSLATTLGVGAATPSASGAGITFPATQSASSDANTLDDYEEGTWTPVPVPGTGSITSYTSSGSYRKIGTNVIITGVIAITNAGTGGTGITITGAPFTSLTYAYGVMKDTLGGNIYFSDIAESSTSLNPQTLTNGYLPVVTATYRFSISYIAS